MINLVEIGIGCTIFAGLVLLLSLFRLFFPPLLFRPVCVSGRGHRQEEKKAGGIARLYFFQQTLFFLLLFFFPLRSPFFLLSLFSSPPLLTSVR